VPRNDNDNIGYKEIASSLRSSQYRMLEKKLKSDIIELLAIFIIARHVVPKQSPFYTITVVIARSEATKQPPFSRSSRLCGELNFNKR